MESPAESQAESPAPNERGTGGDGTLQILRTLARYVDLSKLWPWMLAYAALVLVVYPIDKVLVPVLVSRRIVAWAAAPAAKRDARLLGEACAWLVAALVLTWAIWSALYFIGLRLQHLISVDMKRQMVREALEAHERRRSAERPLGRWFTHLENVPAVLEQVFLKLLSFVLPELTGLVVVTGFLFYVDPVLGAITLAFVGASAAYFLWNVGHSQRLAKRDYAYQSDYHQRIHSLLDNMAYVQSSRSVPFELARVREDSRRFLAVKRAFGERNTRFQAGLSVLLLAFVAAVVARCYARMRDPALPAAQLALYGAVFVVLMVELKDLDYAKSMLTEMWNYTYKSSVFFEDEAADAEDEDEEEQEQPAPPTTATDAPPLELRELIYASASASAASASSTATSPAPLLRAPLSARFPARRLHALTGPSGCGKTTLARLIAGVGGGGRPGRRPLAGAIVVDGHDLTGDPAERRRRVTYLPQSVKLFEGTLLENLAYTCTHLTEAQVRAALREHGVDALFMRDRADVHYLRRHVGTAGSTMSGGQKQMLLLMRTYLEATHACTGGGVLDPAARPAHRVFVFDEPTASLNASLAAVALAVLRALAREHTVLIITHDPAVAKRCDSRLRLAGRT
jgi:ABC-type multidrug transport system fused ATPase/permease subunit